MFRSQVVEITRDTLLVETPEGRQTLANDFVLALTGYHPDFEFLERLGVTCAEWTGSRQCHKETWRAMCRESIWPG